MKLGGSTLHEDMTPGPPALRPVLGQPDNMEIILAIRNHPYHPHHPQDQWQQVPADLSWGDLPCRLVDAFPAYEGRKSLWHKFDSPKSLSVIEMGKHSAATRLIPYPPIHQLGNDKTTFCSECILPAQPGSTVELPPWCSKSIILRHSITRPTWIPGPGNITETYHYLNNLLNCLSSSLLSWPASAASNAETHIYLESEIFWL